METFAPKVMKPEDRRLIDDHMEHVGVTIVAPHTARGVILDPITKDQLARTRRQFKAQHSAMEYFSCL